MTHLTWQAFGLALATSVSLIATVARAELPLTEISIPGVPGEALQRFLGAAALTHKSDGTALFYDFVTRCTAVMSQDDVGRTNVILLSAQTERGPLNAPRVALAARRDIEAVTAGMSLSAEDASCAEEIRVAYGGEFERDARELGAVTRHAISVLRGADIQGAGATASPLAMSTTEEARSRLSPNIQQPLLLGALRSADRTVLIVGEPLASYRWIVSYKNLTGGRWQFEGGIDAQYLQ